MKLKIEKFSDVKLALLIAVAFTVIYIATFDHFSSSFVHDEFRDMLVARSIRQQGVPLFLEHNFYKHPPFFFIMLAVTGLQLDLSAAIIVLSFSFLTLFSFYFLARKFGSKEFAVIATLLLAAHPNMWVWSNRFLHETSLLFVFIASVYLVVDLKDADIKKSIALGLLMGIGYLDKVTCFLIPLIILFYLLVSKQLIRTKKKKLVLNMDTLRNLVIALVLSIIIYYPWMWYTGINNAPSTFDIWLGQITGQVTWTEGAAEPWYYHIITLPELLTWFIIPFFVFGIYILLKQKRPLSDEMILPLLWFIIIIGFFSLPSHKEVKFVNPSVPAGVLLATYGVFNLKKFEKSFTKQRIRYLSLVLVICLAVSSLLIVLYDGHWIADWTLWPEIQSLESDGVLLAGPYWWAINLFTDGIFVDYLYGNFQTDLYSILAHGTEYIVVDSSYAYVQDQSLFTLVSSFPDYNVLIYSVNWDTLTQKLISQGTTPVSFYIKDNTGNPVEGVRLFSNNVVVGRTKSDGTFTAFMPEGMFSIDLKKICYDTKSVLIAIQNSTTFQCQSTTMCQPATVILATINPASCLYHPDYTLDRF